MILEHVAAILLRLPSREHPPRPPARRRMPAVVMLNASDDGQPVGTLVCGGKCAGRPADLAAEENRGAPGAQTWAPRVGVLDELSSLVLVSASPGDTRTAMAGRWRHCAEENGQPAVLTLPRSAAIT